MHVVGASPDADAAEIHACMALEASALVCELESIFRVDIGFHMGTILWTLLESLCKIHVLQAYPYY